MRTLLALGLFALLARADRIVVRIVIGDKPAEGVGLVVLKPGWTVVFDHDAWAPKILTDKAGGAVVNVPKDGKLLAYRAGFALAIVYPEAVTVDIALRPERIFAGTVVDSQGNPVKNAAAMVKTVTRRYAHLLAKTDAKGRFFVYGLWLDNYKVEVRAPGYVRRTFDTKKLVERIVLRRAGSVAGVVVDRENKPVAGVPVQMFGFGPIVSDAKGAFFFDGVEPGRNHKLETPPPFGYHPVYVNVKEGEARKDVRLPHIAPAELTMRLVDHKQQPFAGVKVTAWREKGAVSDAQGRVRMRVRPRQDHQLTFDGPNGERHAVAVGPEQPGGKRDLKTIVIPPVPMVVVSVVTPEGKPAAGVVAGEKKAKLVDGKVSVAADGRLYTVESDGYPPVRFQARVPGPVEITLPVPLWLEGIVRDPAGQPVEGAQVIVETRTVLTTKDGVFRIGPFDHSFVHVQARTGSLRSRSFAMEIGEGRLEIDLVDARKQLVKGRVLRGDRPVERFAVNGVDVLDEDGRFEVLVARGDHLTVADAQQRYYHFPLRASGEAVLRLPSGEIRVALQGKHDNPTIRLHSETGDWLIGQGAKPGDDGSARFGGLADGVYFASADGFVRARVTVGARVRLEPAPRATLRLLLPEGVKAIKVEAGTIEDFTVQKNKSETVSVYRMELDAGEERTLDLRRGAELRIVGEAGWEIEFASKLLRYRVILDDKGVWKGRVVSGRYRVWLAKAAFLLDVGAGTQELKLPTRAPHKFRSLVMRGDGRPAQAVVVYLIPPGGERYEPGLIGTSTHTDLAGTFEFGDLPRGTYRCLARVPGYADAWGRFTIERDGRRTETGFPLLIRKSANVRVLIENPTGQPLRRLGVLVDDYGQETDALGVVTLARVPARIGVRLKGYATVRNHEIRGPGTLRLQLGADLLVRFDPDKGPVTVRIGGEDWPGEARALGELLLEDLPPGPVEVRQGAQEAAEEPDIVQSRLKAGERLTLDLREG